MVVAPDLRDGATTIRFLYLMMDIRAKSVVKI